jgi:hypothetical protein
MVMLLYMLEEKAPFITGNSLLSIDDNSKQLSS